jgi:flagellar motor switch protein FliG
MTQLSPAIRKAAVLVSTLDERAADALLDQVPAETAARVRRALMELGDVPAEEQQAVLAEFFQGGKVAPRSAEHHNDDPGVELDV